MRINFNIKKLDQLLSDFYKLTGFTISVWDDQFHQLSYQPKEMCGFCRMIKNSSIGKRQCLMSDKAICMESKERMKPITHYCYAGLYDTAIPIEFQETVIGYIMFGQARGRDFDHSELLKRLSVDLQVNYQDLLAGYKELPVYDEEKVIAAANLLKNVIRGLWLSKYIDAEQNTLVSRLDDYIKEHMAEDLSVKTIGNALGVSKNRLYSTAHRWFEMPLGQYITLVRMNEAKHMLSSTDVPIHEIAVMIGIDDYNYFSKVFKRKVGMTPIKYRRNFPFSLHENK